ncbi:MAG TPA: hypothetical protein PK644_08650 [bacterium]|nr:hypothetical protein [bacterium]
MGTAIEEQQAGFRQEEKDAHGSNRQPSALSLIFLQDKTSQSKIKHEIKAENTGDTDCQPKKNIARTPGLRAQESEKTREMAAAWCQYLARPSFSNFSCFLLMAE